MSRRPLPDSLKAAVGQEFRVISGGKDNTHELRGGKLVPLIDNHTSALNPRVWAPMGGGNIPPRPVMHDNLTRGLVSVTAAPGGTGKSLLKAATAMALATGFELTGVTINKPLRVLYLDMEDPKDENARKFEAIAQHHEVTIDDVGDRLHMLSAEEHQIIIATQGPDGLVLNETAIADLIAYCRKHEIDVIIADPFVSTHDVSENDNSAMDAVIKRGWVRIAREANVAVDLVHHMRKIGNGGEGYEPTADDLRGGRALVDAARSVHILRKMSRKEAEDYGIPLEKAGYYLAVNTRGKANNEPPSEELRWFQLVSEQLNNGTDEYPADNMGVPVRWYPPKLTDHVEDVAQLRIIQLRAAEGMWRASDQRRAQGDWIGCLVAEVLGKDTDSASDRRIIKRLLAQWIKNGVLKQVDRTPQGERKSRPFVTMGEPIDD